MFVVQMIQTVYKWARVMGADRKSLNGVVGWDWDCLASEMDMMMK